MIDRSPENSAREFAQVVGMIYSPPSATSFENALEGFSGGILRVRSFTPGVSRAMPEVYAAKLKGLAEELLEGLNITSSFSKHIIGLLEEALGNGMMRMAGSDLVLSQCGVKVRNNRIDLGIYDPLLAPGIEKEALLLSYQTPSLLGFRESPQDKMGTWVKEYTEKHHINPLAE